LAISAPTPSRQVAYAEEIRIFLALAVRPPLSLSGPDRRSAITFLIGFVSTSYWQTIPRVSRGGGAYTVARENLGTLSRA